MAEIQHHQREALSDSRETNTERADPTACSRFFGTVELVESMLHYLPCRNLFVVCQVSKEVDAVVHGSLGIQKAMFHTTGIVKAKSNTASTKLQQSGKTFPVSHHGDQFSACLRFHFERSEPPD